MLVMSSSIYPPPEAGWRDLPPIVSEGLIHKFTYWNVSLKHGMRYGNELYMRFQTYPITERLKACDVACECQSQGIEVCITASKTTYTVWLSLRSLNQLLADAPAQTITVKSQSIHVLQLLQ